MERMWIKHHVGSTSIKRYDMLGLILRIETATNEVPSLLSG